MDAGTLVLLVVGLILLVAGAELLVRGAARLAAAAGISALVVGLTVVSFGTSSPELAVSVASSLRGQADLALGNVVGSNIFNILFILGISALITPLVVAAQLVRRDVPLMIAISLLLLLLALDGTLGRLDGLVLFAGIVTYTAWSIREGRRESAQSAPPPVPGSEGDRQREKTSGFLLIQVGLVLAGLVLLVLGSRWLVEGAVTIARTLGVSELVIGLTIIAAGTSLPEVATSVLAAIRGERDIAVGNVVGSNIFNILAVLGLSGLVAPAGIPVAGAALRFDIPVMIGVSVACLPIFFTRHLLARWEGALFLAFYVAYVAYLTLHAIDHPALESYRTAMVLFVLPLTAVTLLVLAARAVWGKVGQAGG